MQVHEKEKEVLNVFQDTLARESAPVEKTSQGPGSPKEDWSICERSCCLELTVVIEEEEDWM